MKSFIDKIFPPDPPLLPMTLSREPIVNRFWATGLLGLVLGFIIGFMLWLWQQGVLEVPEDYFNFKLLHARIQILLFAGSFLLGFALQAGPHVIGGPPPPSQQILIYLPLLWVGTALSIVTDPALQVVGNILISLAFGVPAFMLFGITKAGNPALRIPRGIPIASAFSILALSPWLALDNPDIALFVIWCGPITAALVAAQQLTNNVLGGSILQGAMAKLFALFLALAWLASAAAAYHEAGSWQLAGALWLVVAIIQMLGTNFISAALKYQFSAIQVTLVLAFIGIATAAIMPLVSGDTYLADAGVHLLGAGVITVLILGVAARVAGFFCGHMVLRDRGVIYLILAWSILAIVRTVSSTGFIDNSLVIATIYMGIFLLLTWTIPMADRLIKIGRQYRPATNILKIKSNQ